MEKCMLCSRILSDGQGIAWCICERCAARIAIKKIQKAEEFESKQNTSIEEVRK
jgi:DNA-directed RNA polymerase subunit RPC12/RpoP